MYQVTEILGVYYGIVLQSITYQNVKGEIALGNESVSMMYRQKLKNTIWKIQ